MEIDGIPIPKDYKSPLEERGETDEEEVIPHPIPTRNAFKAYLEKSPQPSNAFIYGRFIWGSPHIVGEGRHLVRVHLTDLFAPQSPAILKSKYEDQYVTHPYLVNKDLMTGTIWVPDATPLNFPACGQKMKVLRFTEPKLFRGECCQFTTRYQDLEFEKPKDAKSDENAETGDTAGESDDATPIKIENTNKKRKLK